MITLQKPTKTLYEKYPYQTQPQTTFLSLDPSNRILSAHTNPEIGNAVPVEVWNGVVRRYGLHNPSLTAREIGHIMSKIKPLANQVCDGFEIVWNGNNHVGKLSKDAFEAEEKIYEYLWDI